MKRITLCVIVAMATIVSMAAEKSLSIVPLPAEMTAIEMTPFTTDRAVAIRISDDVAESTAKMIGNLAGELFRIEPSGAVAKLVINADEALPAEGYSLKVHSNDITIAASTASGFFYAFQTLKQMLHTSADGALAAVEIVDEPRMEWRGFMLDEGRHIFGKEEIKRIIDIMSLYKFNRLHWHLTEDQGWRLEIKKYPKLTEIGAWRESQVIEGPWIQPEVLDKPYGGYYTQDDVREIVEYAKARFVEIVPEIDMPGHTQAMVASYPELLACDPDSAHSVWYYSGVSHDVINVAKPEALQMTKDIIDEVIALFPYEYIHLGGDECPTSKWEKNEQCIARLKEIGSTNFRDLQLDFYRQLQDHIATKPQEQQRKLIFWNEVLHGNTSFLSDSITVMSWIGTEEAERDGRTAAMRGFDVVMTPQVPYYINRRQSLDPREPRTQGPGTETLEKVYTYKPLTDVPYGLLHKYKGVQANFWTEFVPDASTLEYMILPRLTAVAEAAWTPSHLRNYNDFVGRLRPHSKIFNKMGMKYAPYIFE